MSNENKNETLKVATVEKPTHTVKGIDVVFTFTESKAKAGKEATQYWKVDMTQFAPKVDDKLTGDAKDTAEAQRKETFYAAVESLVGGFDNLLNEIDARLNVGVKAAQMEQGKDVYNKAEKLGYATEYVTNDFGATSRVGGGLANAINNLKKEKEEMGNLLAKLNSLMAKFATADAKSKGAVMAEILACQSDMAKYATQAATENKAA